MNIDTFSKIVATKDTEKDPLSKDGDEKTNLKPM